MEHRLLIDGWRTNLRFSSCHVLLRHDKCSRLHGHSYGVHLDVRGELDENHMLVDFGKVKKTIRYIADELDHRTLVPTENPDIRLNVINDGENLEVSMPDRKYSFPICDVVKLPIPTTTVEELSKYLLRRFMEEFQVPDGVSEISLGVDEGIGQGAWSRWAR
ncbi:MAG: 6-pyruvoyl trahydropterin synthase family protein [Thermoplasmatota archaeon]